MANGTDILQKFLDSLKNPRYHTGDPQADAPIELDGIYNGVPTMFVAHPHDVMPYGVDTWNKAQAGHYGPIAPYNPTLETVQKQAIGHGALAASIAARETGLGDTALAATLEVVPAMTARIGKEALGSKQFERIANLWGVPLGTLPEFISNLDDFRFAIVTVVADLKQSVQKATNKSEVKAAVEAFATELNSIIETYNATNPPIPVTQPAAIVVPGL